MALQSSNPSSSFSQQGTIDWVQLSSTTVSASLSVFARLSAANIHTTTLMVGQALGMNFKLSLKGQTRVQEALKSLKSCSSVGNVIWFGFGVEHPIRQLAQTTHGSSCIALCASLSEVSSDTEAAALIMAELANLYNAPEELAPSLQQWQALLESNSGALMASPFGCVVDHFMRLSGDCTKRSRRFADPESLAKALQAIARLSTGSLVSITLVGSWMCGYLAAFGHWFLGLDVEIRHVDHGILYTSTPTSRSAQIYVLYGESSITDMQLLSSSYIIRNVDTVLSEGYQLTAGRGQWHEAIQQTFGSVGISLLGAKHTFGLFLGSMGQIFSGVAHAHPSLLRSISPKPRLVDEARDLPPHWRGWRGYNTNSYGKGYVTFASTTFPELLDLKSNMDACLDESKPYTSTISDLEMTSSNLTKMCCCQACEDKPHSNQSRFCVLHLAETIAILIWSLSQVNLEANIKPTRSGLEYVYFAWRDYKTDRAIRFNFVRQLLYLERAMILQTVEAVFTGTANAHLWNESLFEAHRQRDDSRIAAYSTKGLCIYVATLARLTDQPGEAAHFHVLPGVIELKSGRRYRCIRDMHRPTQGYEAESCKPLDTLQLDADTSTADLRVDLILKETVKELLVSFRFSSSKGEFSGIGPASLAESILRSTGLFHCPRTGCPKLRPPYKSIFTLDGEGSLPDRSGLGAGRRVVIRQLGENEVARCLCCVMSHGRAILRLDECLSCCIKAAFPVEMKDPFFVI